MRKMVGYVILTGLSDPFGCFTRMGDPLKISHNRLGEYIKGSTLLKQKLDKKLQCNFNAVRTCKDMPKHVNVREPRGIELLCVQNLRNKYKCQADNYMPDRYTV